MAYEVGGSRMNGHRREHASNGGASRPASSDGGKTSSVLPTSWWQTAGPEGFTAICEQRFPKGSADRGPKAEKKKAPGAIPESKECAWEKCHKKFLVKLRGPHRLFCSHACTSKASKQRLASRRGRRAA
jgi:hypothetical protein